MAVVFHSRYDVGPTGVDTIQQAVSRTGLIVQAAECGQSIYSLISNEALEFMRQQYFQTAVTLNIDYRCKGTT